MGWVENIAGKGENAGYQHFSPFPTMFSKGFFFRVVKSWDCVVKWHQNKIHFIRPLQHESKLFFQSFSPHQKTGDFFLPFTEQIWLSLPSFFPNKRAMMALNRSPESVSSQNEFYLLYYYCSSQFWPQGYHMNRIDIGPNIIVQGQMIKALLLLVSEKKNFKVFLLCSYVSNLWPPGWGPTWPQGHHMNNHGRGPLEDATYEISKLCTF